MFESSSTISGEIKVTPDSSFYVDGISTNTLSIYAYNNGVATLNFTSPIAGGPISRAAINANATEFACATNVPNVNIFYECPNECLSCSSYNYCSACVAGYNLQNGNCSSPSTPCVGNRKYKNGVCEEFCHEKCKSCGDTWTECTECADLYVREGGDCVMNDDPLTILSKIRPFIVLLRSSGIKTFLFILADLRLYEYHQKKYDGMAKQVFVVARFLEDKQWEIVGLLDVKEELESSIEVTRQYHCRTPPISMQRGRVTSSSRAPPTTSCSSYPSLW